MEGTERRARVRAKVNFFACVASREFGEDVVTCMDMSKGGVGFHTKNQYAKEMRVTIAVPYAPEAKEAPAIFVNGRIANVNVLEGGVGIFAVRMRQWRVVSGECREKRDQRPVTRKRTQLGLGDRQRVTQEHRQECLWQWLGGMGGVMVKLKDATEGACTAVLLL